MKKQTLNASLLTMKIYFYRDRKFRKKRKEEEEAKKKKIKNVLLIQSTKVTFLT